ncbi:MAG TPA: Xaa-Pro peptidase family protein [Tepidisphaeraceae bacterium]|nr:Xaa-Pro peptidase family protein [Tepidisphaeraceae bacterium]
MTIHAMLDPNLSRQRQRRLLKAMNERRLDAAVVAAPHHVYYLSAFHPHWLQFAAMVLFADGRSWLACGNSPAQGAAADEIALYEATWNGTQRSEQPAIVAAQVRDVLKGARAKTVAIDASAVSAPLAMMLAESAVLEPIDPVLWQLRRVKDADELALMRRAIGCADAMYRRARQIVEPGVAEVDVYAELTAAAIRAAGEPLTAPLGNDYACGVGGGPARPGRTARAGELYILDVGPCYRHYFADACRAISVDRNPTDAQHRAWQAIVDALRLVESMARPGVRCRDLYAAVDEHLARHRDGGLPHHLGHGVGLQPHEYPHLNPKWDDVLMEGEVFTAEPGLYGADLAGGIRLENLYRVTKSSAENMLSAPLEMT